MKSPSTTSLGTQLPRLAIATAIPKTCVPAQEVIELNSFDGGLQARVTVVLSSAPPAYGQSQRAPRAARPPTPQPVDAGTGSGRAGCLRPGTAAATGRTWRIARSAPLSPRPAQPQWNDQRHEVILAAVPLSGVHGLYGPCRHWQMCSSSSLIGDRIPESSLMCFAGLRKFKKFKKGELHV